MRMATPFLCWLLLGASAFADFPKEVVATNGAVVCVSPPAAEIGLAVLKQGGNAVDATVAVAFALAVTWPEAGNIGGGGFMHVWPGAGKPPVVFDYRETAPAKSTPKMFVETKAGADSHLSCGVPGTVRGMAMAHAKYGKRPWKDLIDPAVKLATDGFPVTAGLAGRMNGVLLERTLSNKEFVRVYAKNGSIKERWQAGDIMKLPDLGKTLARIRDDGADSFYTGVTADLLVNEMIRGQGIVTKEDLQNYRAIERPSLSVNYRGHTVYAPPLPSGGGVILLESLNILDRFPLARHPKESPETIHLMSEAMRRAFADRAQYMGDPAFVKPIDHLLTANHAERWARTIDPAKASKSEELPGAVPLSDIPEGESTTHFSIIDKDGMAVANTYTLENPFGSRIVVRGAGFLLNNEMTDFNIRPGITNRAGTVGTEPNRIAPGKRMLSSQCPTFVARDGQLRLVTGSPGGRTIPNTVLNIVVNVVDYGMDARAAVDAPRHHQQWFPDRIQLERMTDRVAIEAGLRARGHQVAGSRQGDAHSIVVDPKTGKFMGAADRRLDGASLGY
jgi:gamma-glutamyltranspeptidase/glutathione hydrolase